ncbi:glycoside hydrolase family 3 C-terminal domain-containing protein [Nocardia donostiensis]|uniref:Exo-alpha-(1->6)-L-arabinopyranosidase n=1 Tax=Nocardia donostiensis TaxID=1538463 RepID=A0A1W0BA31_9NOCA|nr:glycoside hydrolase family 3 C-terminal domain-containing protein [Nocardia donostiensis]ONM50025.1 glycosyl hydrolase [Nocardia donostiensis]OQS19390.1 glycosyl hydrolase [Nocardia donostiensis]
MEPTPDLTGLSLEQKAALGSGADFWTTKAAGPVAPMVLTDGPHGVRKQAEASDPLGLAVSLPATCFPPAVGLGQSWDVELVRRVGVALGQESRTLGVDVLLGPGINIKRDPRCGRNFEYYSEDPILTGALGTAWVAGLQSTGVGASLKHFAANNAEHDRMRSSSDVDPRPLREIYLRAFAHIVRTAAPWTVMCSYNRINGVHAAENHWLLTAVLRDEWGFDGVVVSDWGAVTDRVAAVAAGLDLEMPGSGGASDAAVVAAVRAGDLDPAVVDRAAERVAALAKKAEAARRHPVGHDPAAHHALAREVAARCVVLLQNDNAILPLSAGQSIAVIGEFAENPRYQGGGSSRVNATQVDIPLAEIRALAGQGAVRFARGFTTDDTTDETLRAEAVEIAAAADTAVVFLGLAARQESEGFDRDDIELPAGQLELLTEVVRVQPATVVVLVHGGVLRLAPVAGLAPAILDAALLGQAGGGAIADILFGKVTPSGRLTETVPVRIQDTPAYVAFPGENSHVRYGEGLYVGYRWYDARELEVTYPFGHGLSYTTFAYSDLTVTSADDMITVQVTVTNTGSRAGREVVQCYTAKPDSSVTRPPRELKGFAVTDLEPGMSERVSIMLRRDDLAYWETRVDRWIVEDGDYQVCVGASSRDIRLTTQLTVAGDPLRLPITLDSTLGEVMNNPDAGPLLEFLARNAPPGLSPDSGGAALGIDMARMVASFPLRLMVGFSQNPDGRTELEQLIASLDGGEETPADR